MIRRRIFVPVACVAVLVTMSPPVYAVEEPSPPTTIPAVTRQRPVRDGSPGTTTTVVPTSVAPSSVTPEVGADNGRSEAPSAITADAPPPASPPTTASVAETAGSSPAQAGLRAPAPAVSPGAAPATAPAAFAATLAAAVEETGGLHTIANERGRVSRSISGVTSDSSSGGQLVVQKPAGATVRKAYFFVASTGFTATRLTSPLRIDAGAVVPEHETASGISSFNYWNDVTAMVKTKLDGAAPGAVGFTVVEADPARTDGEVMVVIFDDPNQALDRTVSVLFGALRPSGDEYRIGLARPISLADPATHLEMSLGISFSYQSDGTQQYSTVDVNGRRLTTAAGGEDDGNGHNGALLTVGGTGDGASNPVDPTAPPTNPRSDDELYDLRPFVKDGDTTITVRTTNPSFDDNIFLATFTMNPPVTSLDTGGGPQYVAVGDSTTTGFSVPTCKQNRTTSPFGCVGSPPATPYPDRIAAARSQFADLERVGIWGYTVHEAVADANAGRNKEGPWVPQLLAAQDADRLVTVSLGANDMQFSDVVFWLKECLAKQFTTLKSTCLEAARAKAESIRPDVRAMMARLDQAKANGATVAITLYYNPYNDRKDSGPFNIAARDCSVMWAMSEIIVGSLNNVLKQEALSHGFSVVDLRPAFRNHGAGATDSFVFGIDCDAAGAATAVDLDFNLGWPPVRVNTESTKAEIQKRFDPHPNDKGTAAQANEVLKVVG